MIQNLISQNHQNLQYKSNSYESLYNPGSFKLFEKDTRNKTARFFCVYHGMSMNPYLHESDILEVVPYDNQPIKVGDVILFPHPQKKQNVVHRVTAIRTDGVCTRGDSNPTKDDWKTAQNHIQGRVVAAWRGNRFIEITGGVLGRLTAAITYLGHRILYLCYPLVRRTYFTLKRSNLLIKVLPNRYQPRIIAFHTSFGTRKKMLIGKRIVGFYKRPMKKWQISPFYRLFIDDQKLM